MRGTGPRLGFQGQPEPTDLPHRAGLVRAVEIGGEGGSLTLLGPVEGNGEFFVVRQTVLDVNEDGFATYGGATLLPAGRNLVLALGLLNPIWFSMVGLYVAPHFQDAVRTLLEQIPGARRWEDWWQPRLGAERPMRCRFVWPNTSIWPDEVAQDGFWVEGSLDQVQHLLGYLPYDHQVQLNTAANKPFVLLISRDGCHRHALPHFKPTEEDDPWPDDSFLPLQEFDLMLTEELRFVPVPDLDQQAARPESVNLESLQQAAEKTEVLGVEAAMSYYQVVRRAEEQALSSRWTTWENQGPPGETLWRMAQLTWPFQVMRFKPGEGQTRPRYVVFFVRGQGMEEELWTLKGDRRERDAVRLSILLRNIYSAGNRDALSAGQLDWFLNFALPMVKQVNTAWAAPTLQ